MGAGCYISVDLVAAKRSVQAADGELELTFT